MEDRNSPEAIAARATQPDPIVMYLIVRESLSMSIGKTAAQAAHASQMLQLKYFNRLKFIEDLKKEPAGFPVHKDDWILLFEEWLDTSFRKVVLKADDKEWQKIKDSGLKHVVVVDAGLTEIAPGSETVIGICPMRKSNVPKLIKRLQVLK